MDYSPTQIGYMNYWITAVGLNIFDRILMEMEYSFLIQQESQEDGQ